MKLQALVTYSETRIVDFEAASHEAALGTLRYLISESSDPLGVTIDRDVEVEVIGTDITAVTSTN